MSAGHLGDIPDHREADIHQSRKDAVHQGLVVDGRNKGQCRHKNHGRPALENSFQLGLKLAFDQLHDAFIALRGQIKGKLGCRQHKCWEGVIGSPCHPAQQLKWAQLWEILRNLLVKRNFVVCMHARRPELPPQVCVQVTVRNLLHMVACTAERLFRLALRLKKFVTIPCQEPTSQQANSRNRATPGERRKYLAHVLAPPLRAKGVDSHLAQWLRQPLEVTVQFMIGRILLSCWLSREELNSGPQIPSVPDANSGLADCADGTSCRITVCPCVW
mmetsp:Transcript_42708/g.93177  ORF Transcript_42708/g.93177 Transcript_42708/m.93177 type:complete len:274 (-) Transcript_42708:826-1647(-)